MHLVICTHTQAGFFKTSFDARIGILKDAFQNNCTLLFFAMQNISAKEFRMCNVGGGGTVTSQ